MTAEPARARLVRARLTVRGAVQGVGFRPFVCRLARELGLGGFVQNTPGGVLVTAEGDDAAVAALAGRLRADAPAHARVDALDMELADIAAPAARFEIRESDAAGPASAVITPDLAVCAACLAEVGDARGRRHGYPFTTCASCGPRLSILLGLPYDRARTTMAGFAMCRACRREYDDAGDRRFHAETIACASCGPRLALRDGRGRELARDHDALEGALAALGRGAIVAMKGVGGFQLLVDARDAGAVGRLRARKHRPHKPLAVLFGALDQLDGHARCGAAERAALTGPAAPIVLVARDPASDLAGAIAPGAPVVGAMLPCSPLHALIAAAAPVVATSGNLSGEPICIDEHEALARLGGVADLFLVHDRAIARRVDDSVVRVMDGRPVVLRHARGFAPALIAPAPDSAGVVATGGHLKSAIALATPAGLVLGAHIGDQGTAAAADALDRAVADAVALHGVELEAVACDAHPDYHSTRVARALGRARGVPVHAVQHHHAHVLACMADNRARGRVLGVAWDGTGHGLDRTVWGGEFLRVDGARCERVAHLRAFALPGGDVAAREPRRAALGVLVALHGPGAADMTDLAPIAALTAAERRLLVAAIEGGVNAPSTSSAGRLFDAAAALLGLAQRCTFEGQAAMALEHIAAPAADRLYPFAIDAAARPAIVDWGPAVLALIADVRAGVPAPLVSARFHDTLAEIITRVSVLAGEPRVALTGGCFQNARLTEGAAGRLRGAGLEPLCHGRVPPGDGGLALGQLVAATHLEADHVSRRSRKDHRDRP